MGVGEGRERCSCRRESEEDPQACRGETRESQSVRVRTNPTGPCLDARTLCLRDWLSLVPWPVGCVCAGCGSLGPQGSVGWPGKAQTSDFWWPVAWSVYPRVLERNIFHLCFEGNRREVKEPECQAGRWGCHFSILIFKGKDGPKLCTALRPFQSTVIL